MPSALSHPLATWDAARQATYRTQHPDEVFVLHLVLDMSPSMHGAPGQALLAAHNLYLAWLQHHAHPMTLVERCLFSNHLTRQPLQLLSACAPLTEEDYTPLNGMGTALYRAVGEVCTAPRGQGRHILVVFTDGMDNVSAAMGWSAAKAALLLQTLQAEESWLAVFLGAFPQALAIGQAMGFTSGNCLTFPNDQIPEAFQALTRATQRYLAASPTERKLLVDTGVF